MVSEQQEQQEQDISKTDTQQPVTGPGQLLREAREKQGITQQQIADKLYLKAAIIANIEDDVMDDNMSLTFVKGYVRLYAKHVGLDVNTVLHAFETVHSSPKPPAKLQSFSRRVAKQAHDDRWMMVTYVILLGLLAAVFVWWYQQPEDKAPAAEFSSEPAATEIAEPEAQTALPSNDMSNQVEEPATDDTESLAPYEQDPSLAVQEDSTPEVVAGVTDEQSVSTTDLADPVEVVFTFGADCWINIQDATGEAIAYGVKAAGRVMPVSGVPPLEVTLGAPDSVTITYAGEPVDMSSFQNGRTARFTLPMQE